MINLTNAYQEKDSAFECGFSSFLGQNRTEFSVSFFIFGLLFLLFDLEILLVYPYSVSSYTNDIYGLVIMMVFFVLLTLGFIFELGKNALTIDSRQTLLHDKEDLSTPHAYVSSSGLHELLDKLSDEVTSVPSGSDLRKIAGDDIDEVKLLADQEADRLIALKEEIDAKAAQEANQANADLTELKSITDEAAAFVARGIDDLAEAVQAASD